MANIKLSKRSGSVSLNVGTTGIVPSASGIKDKARVGLADTVVQLGGAYAEKFAVAEAKTETNSGMNDLKMSIQQQIGYGTREHAGTNHAAFRDDVYGKIKGDLDSIKRSRNFSSKGSDLFNMKAENLLAQTFDKLDVAGRSRGIEYFEVHDEENRNYTKKLSGTDFNAAADARLDDIQDIEANMGTFMTTKRAGQIQEKEDEWVIEVMENKMLAGGVELIDLDRFVNSNYDDLSLQEQELRGTLSAKKLNAYKARLSSKMSSGLSEVKKMVTAKVKGAIAISKEESRLNGKHTLRARNALDVAKKEAESLPNQGSAEVINLNKSVSTATNAALYDQTLFHTSETKMQKHTPKQVSQFIGVDLVTGVQDVAAIKELNRKRITMIKRSREDYGSITKIINPDLAEGTQAFFDSGKGKTSFQRYASVEKMKEQQALLESLSPALKLEGSLTFQNEFEQPTGMLSQMVDLGYPVEEFLLASQFPSMQAKEMFLNRTKLKDIKSAGLEDKYKEVKGLVTESLKPITGALKANKSYSNTLVSAVSEKALFYVTEGNMDSDDAVTAATNLIKENFKVASYKHNNVLLTKEQIGDSSLQPDLVELMELFGSNPDGDYMTEITGVTGLANGFKGLDGRELNHDFWHEVEDSASFEINSSKTGVNILYFNTSADGGARSTLLNMTDEDGEVIPFEISFEDIKDSHGKWQDAIQKYRFSQTPRGRAQAGADANARHNRVEISKAEIEWKAPLLEVIDFTNVPDQPKENWKVTAQRNVDRFILKSGMEKMGPEQKDSINEAARKLKHLLGQSVFPDGWKEETQKHVDIILKRSGMKR